MGQKVRKLNFIIQAGIIQLTFGKILLRSKQKFTIIIPISINYINTRLDRQGKNKEKHRKHISKTQTAPNGSARSSRRQGEYSTAFPKVQTYLLTIRTCTHLKSIFTTSRKIPFTWQVLWHADCCSIKINQYNSITIFNQEILNSNLLSTSSAKHSPSTKDIKRRAALTSIAPSEEAMYKYSVTSHKY